MKKVVFCKHCGPFPHKQFTGGGQKHRVVKRWLTRLGLLVLAEGTPAEFNLSPWWQLTVQELRTAMQMRSWRSPGV